MEVVELWWLLQDAELDHIVEARQLAILVRDVSKVLMDHGMPPILVILRDPCTFGDVLEMVDIILKCLREAYTSSHNP
jgi:hypothetical protein